MRRSQQLRVRDSSIATVLKAMFESEGSTITSARTQSAIEPWHGGHELRHWDLGRCSSRGTMTMNYDIDRLAYWVWPNSND